MFTFADIRFATKEDIEDFRRDPFSLRSFGLLVRGLSMYFQKDTTPPEERSKTIVRNLSLAAGYAAGLGQNTSKALAGDDIPADSIRSEMPENLLAGAGWSLKAIQQFQELARSSAGFRAWLAEADLNGLVAGAAKAQEPEIAAGFLAKHLPELRRMFGKPLTNAEINDLGRVWSAAANPGEAATLTLENSRRLFDNHRDRFWARVRADAAARRLFTDAGFVFDEQKLTTAPTRVLSDGSTMQVTIDHIFERQTHFPRALDPANLQMSTRRENTVMLRLITKKDPFQ